MTAKIKMPIEIQRHTADTPSSLPNLEFTCLDPEPCPLAFTLPLTTHKVTTPPSRTNHAVGAPPNSIQ